MAVIKPKVYQTFRGVDYSASPAVISEEHASDMLNMYIGEDGVMQKRPGWHILKTFLNVDAFDATATYTVGQYVKYNNKFYKCINEHTGAWDAEDFEEGVPPRLPINGLHYVQYRPGMGMLFIHAGSRLYGTMFVTGASGDVNQTGNVTAADAALILRYLHGLSEFTPVQQALADVNNDGRITEDDAAQILRQVVGLEPFPDGSCGILASSYFRVTYSDGTPLELNNDYSLSFEHDQNLYILDGVRYVRLVPAKQQYTTTTPSGSIKLEYISSVYAEVVEGYIPTTGVNGHYEYLELQSEDVTGDTIVENQEKLAEAVSNVGEADFPSNVFPEKVLVSLTIGSSIIASNAEKTVETYHGAKNIRFGSTYRIEYSGGTATVYGVSAGDSVKLKIDGESEPGVWDNHIVTQQTVTATAANDEAEATFPALKPFSDSVYVTLRVNSSVILNSVPLTVNDNVVSAGVYDIKYASGSVKVTNLYAGDSVRLFIKEADYENMTIGDPGSETNPGEWKAPEADEDRNLLTPKQINTFAADGIHKAYYLNTNACDIDKVELYLWTRCKSVDGVDTPTQEHKSDVDAGTYTDPITGETTYYYYKYIWTESYKESSFTTFSSSATYAAGAKVKYNDLYYICNTAHTGAWNASHFTEVLAWDSRDADSTTKQQNEISYTTRIAFNKAPEAHKEGLPNIRVTFEPRKHNSDWAIAKDRGYIEKCTVMTRFGYFNNNRIWLAGNPDHRSMDFMSGVDDPTYFPNTGWTKIGSDLTAIMGYLHYGSELAIIKEDNNQDATVYMRSAVLTDDNKIIFPVQQGAQGVGAVSKYCQKTLKDEPLFLAKEGVYAIQGTDASQERNVPNRSFYIDKKLKPEIEPCCVAEVFQNYYFVCNPSTGHMFVADARYQGLPPGTNDRQRVYEWYRWDNVPARVLFATDDYLFFGTIDGRLCAFNFDWDNPKRWTDGAEFKEGSTILHKWHPYDGGYPISAYYVTKRDHLNALDFKKTMLNDGGIIVLKPHEQSSAAITVTTDKGSWFVEQVFTDSDEPSVVIPIKKRFKNFDSIQTRIENNEIREGLSILGLQYRYVITTNRR